MNKKYSLNFSHFSDYIHISDDALRHCQTQGLANNRLCRSVGLSVCLSVCLSVRVIYSPTSQIHTKFNGSVCWVKVKNL